MRGTSWALVLWLCGCAGGAPAGRTPEPPAAGSASYAPFEAGSVLAYETHDDGSGERGLVVLRVSRPRPSLVELDDGGSVQRLYVEGADLRHATGGYLLKGPLQRGASFRGRFGRVTVTRVDVAVKVPAGSFTGCLETMEETPARDKRARTVFCPGVGMVTLEVEGDGGAGGGRVRFVLKSYGPAVDLDAPPPDPK
jgi:hypothetical protein